MKKLMLVLCLLMACAYAPSIVLADRNPLTPFTTEVKEGDKVVKVYSASWCSGCRTYKLKTLLSPRVRAKVFGDYKNRFHEVDIDVNRKETEANKITKIPATVMFEMKDGKLVEVKRIEGNLSIDQLLEFLK